MGDPSLRVSRATRVLLLSLSLLACVVVLRGFERAAIAGVFCVDFFRNGQAGLLALLTPAPSRTTAVVPDTRPITADFYVPRGSGRAPGVVLVHGLVPEGKDDPRLRRAADLLARGGFRVLVPDIPGMRVQRMRPSDANAIKASVEFLLEDPRTFSNRVGILAFSFGVGPALLAAADPSLRGRVAFVGSLGGYASVVELLRYFTTGYYRYRQAAGQVVLDPSIRREFLAQNIDLVRNPVDRARLEAIFLRGGKEAELEALGPEGKAVYALLTNRDPARVDALVVALSPEMRGLIEGLSPLPRLSQIRARLLLVHGREDPAIPHTETLRLYDAVRPYTAARVGILGVVGHVEPGTAQSYWAQAKDALVFWSFAYDLFRQ